MPRIVDNMRSQERGMERILPQKLQKEPTLLVLCFGFLASGTVRE